MNRLNFNDLPNMESNAAPEALLGMNSTQGLIRVAPDDIRINFKSRRRTVCLVGDSITDRCRYIDGTTYTFINAKGWFSWAQAEMGQPWRLLNIAAAAGFTMAQAVNLIEGNVIPFAPDDCIIMAGVNDANAWTTAAGIDATFAALMRGIELLKGANIRPIITTLLPITGLSTSLKQNGWFEYNDRVREYAANDSNVVLVDLAARTYSDRASGYGALSSHVDDAFVHPNTLGAQVIGKAFKASMPEMVMPRFAHPGVVAFDPRNGAGAINANRAFIASDVAGGKTGTPLPTGNVVTGHSLQGACTNNTGTTIVASVVAATDGGNDWQRIVFTGAGMSGQAALRFLLNNSGTLTLASSNFAVGDYVEALIEIAVDAGQVGFVALMPQILFTGAANGRLIAYSPRAISGGSGFVAVGDMSGMTMLGSIPTQIPPGTTNIGLALDCQGLGNLTAASIAFNVRNFQLRKVTLPRTPSYNGTF